MESCIQQASQAGPAILPRHKVWEQRRLVNNQITCEATRQLQSWEPSGVGVGPGRLRL